MAFDRTKIFLINNLLDKGNTDAAFEELEFLPLIPPLFGRRLLSQVLALSRISCNIERQGEIIRTFLINFAEQLTEQELQTLNDPTHEFSDPLTFLEFHELFFELCKNTLDQINEVTGPIPCSILLALASALGKVWRPTQYENWNTRGVALARWTRHQDVIRHLLRDVSHTEVPLTRAKKLDDFATLVSSLYLSTENFEAALALLQTETQIEQRTTWSSNLLYEAMGLLKKTYVAVETPFLPKPPSRYADFTFFHAEGDQLNEKVADGHVLQAKKWYQLEVAVRVVPTGIPLEALERFSIREPKQKEDVIIMVTAEGEGFEIAEPVQTLVLPPFGDSKENAWFQVYPLRPSVNNNDLAKIRIRLYYNLNLIEVVVVKAEVISKLDNATRSQQGLTKPILFEQERLERDYVAFDNVQPRKMQIDITKQGDHFLFNFAFQKDKNQKIIFTAPVRLLATDLEDDLINIRKIWYDIALSKTFSKGLQGDADEFLENIRKLAGAGRRIWGKLFKRERKSSIYKIGTWLERHPIERNAIIQITLSKDAANFVFPWALIYDRAVPKERYKLPNLDGFWGVRCNIEQHVPETATGTDEPIHIDDTLTINFMLYHYFRNAKEEISLMETFMKQSMCNLKVTIPPVTDAAICYDLLNDCNAHILYFYCHGYTRHRLADIGVGPNLDIFLQRYERLEQDSPLRDNYQLLYESIKQKNFEPDRSWIELSYGKLYLDELYDYVEDLRSNPFVILNMCESAQVTPSLAESFIHFFLDRGATGVIGTECPMTVEFAHPFAERLLHDVLTGEGIGIALLNARRHFLEYKNPLGLAYSLFGLATTRFEPPRL